MEWSRNSIEFDIYTCQNTSKYRFYKLDIWTKIDNLSIPTLFFNSGE